MTLHKAAAASDVKRLKALLNKGTPIDARDRGGRTPLLLAAQSGKLGAIRLLLEAGADPNAESKDGERPLTAAMLYGTPAVVQVLVDHGAEVNFFDQGHDTPLMCAVGYGSPKMLELLLKAGADPSTRRADGRSALDLIDGVITSGVIGVRATDHQIRKLLIDAGAKPARAANPKSPPRPATNKRVKRRHGSPVPGASRGERCRPAIDGG